MPLIETTIYEDNDLRVIEERDAAINYRGERVEWKPGTPESNRQLTRGQMETAAQKFGDIRVKMQAARDGFNANNLGANQQRRAWADIADAVNDIAGYLRNVERQRTGTDGSAPPA